MILTVSWPGDEHARAVMGELSRLDVPAWLLDLSRFPQHLGLAIRYDGDRWAYELTGERESLPLGRAKAIWWRRPQPFSLHPEVAAGEYADFSYSEAVEAFAGLWQSLDTAWVNHPVREQAAARKVFQLRVAQEAGLEIPRTLVTNDPDEARAFVASNEAVAYKTFLPAAHDWRETRVLRGRELEQLDAVRYAPVIFQEYLPVQRDLRVTWIGGDAIATAIAPAEDSYAADYRIGLERASVEPVDLPTDVRDDLSDLMGRLDLAYGAIDMRVTPEGRHVFLEVNPSGEWLFVERRSGQPITARFARLLADIVAPWPRDKTRARRAVHSP